jgi:hypothetical protein
MLNNNFPIAPLTVEMTGEYLRKLALSANSAMAGKTNNTGEFTLTASATSTTKSDLNCNTNSVVLAFPKTANAAGALATTYIVPGNKQFVITHANNSQTDRTFRYVVIG